MTAHTLTFRVTREETLDTRTIVWGADPVDAPISTGVTGRTLAELHQEAEAATWFILDVPKDTKIDVRYVYDFDERVAAEAVPIPQELLIIIRQAGDSQELRRARPHPASAVAPVMG